MHVIKSPICAQNDLLTCRSDRDPPGLSHLLKFPSCLFAQLPQAHPLSTPDDSAELLLGFFRNALLGLE